MVVKHVRLLEEVFGDHGEEFAGIRGGVRVDDARCTMIEPHSEIFVFRLADLHPSRVKSLPHRWRTVDRAVEHVEGVRKLVKHDVASSDVLRCVDRVGPAQDDRAVESRLAENRGGSGDDAVALMVLWYHHSSGIDQDA